MSYDPYEAELEEEREAFCDDIINSFTNARLQSYYLKYPNVMSPAFNSLQKSKHLYEIKYYSASILFSTSAIEILLTAGIIKPIIYGLVHNENLANIVAEMATNRNGFGNYKKSLETIISTLINKDINEIRILFNKYEKKREIRDKITHHGNDSGEKEAKDTLEIVDEVFISIVKSMLDTLSFTIDENWLIKTHT